MDVSSTSQALELDRQKIDKELEYTYEVARKLKTRRNTLAYISRLPAEILSRIFINFAHFCSDRSDLSWIRSVTAVCGHWRAVALECPSLWSCIIFPIPIWVEEMLKRSKMAPLTIISSDIQYLKPQRLNALSLALQHVSRIRELRLVASKVDLEKIINPIDKPAPLMQSLCLSNTRSYPFNNNYTLPETLFVGDGHRLQRLELVNCSVPWESPLLCGLVHFKFHNSISSLTTTQLLEALEKMPLIETLDLENSLPTPSDATSPIVHLPHLTSLRLKSSAPGCAKLLNHISFPTSTSLVFSFRFTDTDDGYSTVCDAVSSVWNGRDGSQLLRGLLIRSMHIGAIRLQGWTTTSKMVLGLPSGPTQIDVDLSWSDWIGDKVIIDICNALTMTNLHTLFVYGADLLKATWLSVFGHLTLLRTIHVGMPSPSGFVSALSMEVKGKDGSEEIFVSGLSDLWLEETDFKDRFDGTDLMEELQDGLMTRCHWNAEVQELHLRDCCRLSCHQVELLEEIVVDVDWDGVGESDEYESDEDAYSYEDDYDYDSDEDYPLYHGFF